MAKKATNYEIIQRVKLIVEFLLDGLSRYEIQQYAAKNWELTARPVDTYIAYANKRIGRLADKAEKKAFDLVRTRLERQYRRSCQKADGHLTLKVLDKMCKLYGLEKVVTPDSPDLIKVELVGQWEEEANGKVKKNGRAKSKKK